MVATMVMFMCGGRRREASECVRVCTPKVVHVGILVPSLCIIVLAVIDDNSTTVKTDDG